MKQDMFLFAFPKYESRKRQKAFWEAFDIDYKKMREESRELEGQRRRMIRAKRKAEEKL